jgi:hypothetical protein
MGEHLKTFFSEAIAKVTRGTIKKWVARGKDGDSFVAETF